MHKTPKKPELTTAPMEVLLAEYQSNLDEYNAVTRKFCEARKLDPAERLLGPVPDDIERADLVKLIRKQRNKVGDKIRNRSIQLLLEKKLDEKGHALLRDGMTVGHSYAEILETIKAEFPYCSTSSACLRWYITHSKDEFDDDGELLYEFPEFRARSKPRRATVTDNNTTEEVSPDA